VVDGGGVRVLPLLLGEAVQVDPIRPTLKDPGAKRLKLKCDEPLSKFAFNLHLRRYTWVPDGETKLIFAMLFGISVRRCRLTLSNPR